MCARGQPSRYRCSNASCGWRLTKYCCPARRWRAAPARPKGGAEMAALSVPKARPLDGTFAADEEYGRDGRTRCAAEIRRSGPMLARPTSSDEMIIGVSNGNERTLTRRAACGRAVGGSKKRRRARAAASVATPPRRSPTQLGPPKEPSSPSERSLSGRGREATPYDGQVVLAGERRKNRPQ